MKTKLPLIIILLSVIIISIGVIFAILNDKEKTLDENAVIIRDNYAELSTNVTNNILIRKEVLDKINNFSNNNYADTREEYIELLNKYNENVTKIDTNIEIMDSKCDIQYEDNTINILCRSYADLYEEVINIYITSINNYNDEVRKYNIRNNTNYESHNILHKDYIDINKDGTYQGL